MTIATTPNITTTVEIPENLFTSLATFLDNQPHWSQDRVMTAAPGMFLLNVGNCDRSICETYISAFPAPTVSKNLVEDPTMAALMQPPA
ncbi:MAG: DUF2811 domain-containing protein [Cyanobacteria bacterium P01_D01_bin.56]